MIDSDKLKRLRAPFEPHQVGKLPKGTKSQNDCKPEEKKDCKICGGWHHPKIIHLDYVGHAAATDRLLNVDPEWTWEPVAFGDNGLPQFDPSGGLWIRLTVCGVTRLGYGAAAGKQYMDVGSREKEVIGDAIRNAAMRFGVALDLWHKGDLHIPDPDDQAEPTQPGVKTPRSTAPIGMDAKVSSAPSNPSSLATVGEKAFLKKKLAALNTTERAALDAVGLTCDMDNLTTDGFIAIKDYLAKS